MGDKIKRLSDAIRLGSTMHPQCFHALFRWDGVFTDRGRPSIAGSCAIGAAITAIGKAPTSEFVGLRSNEWNDELLKRWPKLGQEGAMCPDPWCGVSPDPNRTTMAMIVHLNDCHRWTRGKIADWLEGIGF
jgi:hypothetical protein